MTFDSNQSNDQARWACGMLGLDGAASAEASRRAAFDAVANTDYVPDSAKREAIDVVRFGSGYRPETACPSWMASAGTALAAEVEQFAQRFFLLPPDLRLARWSELSRKAASFPAANARLQRLRPCLEVPCEPPPGVDDETRELMRKLTRVFVAPPTKRSEALREAGLLTRTTRMQRAAKTILKRHAEWKPLDPATLERLAGEDVVKSQRLPTPAKVPIATPSDDSGWGRTPALIALWVVIGLIRLASMGGSSQSSSPYRPTQRSPAQYDQIFRPMTRQQLERNGLKLDETGSPDAPVSVGEVLKKLREQAETQLRLQQERLDAKDKDANDESTKPPKETSEDNSNDSSEKRKESSGKADETRNSAPDDSSKRPTAKSNDAPPDSPKAPESPP